MVVTQMQLMDVPEGEYIVFEHGPFDFETENTTVEAEIEKAIHGKRWVAFFQE